MATLSMIPQGDPDLTAYLNDFLRTNKPEQQNNTLWFPTPAKPRKSEYHTPIQTGILKKLIELTEKEKLNPQEITEFRNKFPKRIDWTDTRLTETEKKAIEKILVDYHDNFAQNEHGIQGENNPER